MIRVYAHWLDGTYRKVLTGVTVEHPRSIEDQRAEAVLKTIALFGGAIVLADVQIVDSPVLWGLFSSGHFQRFIRGNPEFLQLVGRPVTAGSDRRWSITIGGLERALKAGWIASPMADANSVLVLSEKIVHAGPTADLDSLLADLQDSPDFTALSGMANAVRHFRSTPSMVSEPPSDRPELTFYSILETALRNPKLVGIDRQHVEATITMVNRTVKNPADRKKRAAVFSHLDLTSPQHLSIWKTIVQAWNVAAQKSVCETGGSIGNIPDSPPIGAYIDQLADVMLTSSPPVDSSMKQSFYKIMPEVPFEWDPANLSWMDLLRVSDDEKCVDARATLLEALSADDSTAVTDAVRKFADALSPLLKGNIAPPVGWWIWALGPVLLRFGIPEAPVLGVALFAGQVGERALVWALNKLRRHVIAARVTDSAARIGLRRQ